MSPFVVCHLKLQLLGGVPVSRVIPPKPLYDESDVVYSQLAVPDSLDEGLMISSYHDGMVLREDGSFITWRLSCIIHF